MQAQVCTVNQPHRLCAADIEGSDNCIIFELRDGFDIEIGDVIFHQDFADTGDDIFTNLTQSEDFEVFVICSTQQVNWRWFEE